MLLPGGLTYQVDIAFTASGPFDASPTWVNVTADLDLEVATTVDLGGSDIAGAAEVGRAVLTFRNWDGRYDPDNPLSPYYPYIVADKPIRIVIGGDFPGEYVFVGTTEEWAADLDRPGRSRLTAQCPLGLLARHQITGVGLRDYILRHPNAPSAYFRLGTADGVELFDEVSGRTRGQYTDFHTVATSLALADPDAAAEVGLGIPSFVGVYGDASPVGSGAFAVLVIVLLRNLPATSTTNEIWELDSPGGTLSLRVNDVGALALQGPGGIAVPGPTIALDTPTAVWVRRAANGVDWGIGIHTEFLFDPTTAAATTAGYTIPAGTALHVGGGASAGADWPGIIDELCVWRSTDPGFTTLADIGRRMVFGLPHMSASARSAYIAAETGLPAGRHITELVDPVTDPSLWGKALPSGTALADIVKSAATVGGDFYSRPDGQLVHRGYRIASASPTPSVTFDDQATGSEVPYRDIVVRRPFTDHRTMVRATDGVRSGEVRTSPTVIAPLTADVSVHQLTTDFTTHRRMAVVAQRFLRRLALTSPRVSLTVSLSHLSSAQRTALAPNLVRNRPVAIVHHPLTGGLGTKTYQAEILRTSWTISAQEVTVRIDTRPARSPWATGFRWTQQPAQSGIPSGSPGFRPALSPRFDTDGHGDALSLFTEVALLPGPADADESVYLVGASSYWDAAAAGSRHLDITDGTSSTMWARSTDRGTSNVGNVDCPVTLLRHADLDTVGMRVQQTSGAGLLLHGSGFPTTNEAFAPDLWGVRVPTDHHSCRLTHNAHQAIVHNGATIVSYNTERWDIGGIHSTASNNDRIVPVRTGLYVLGTHHAWANPGGGLRGQRRADIRLLDASTARGRSEVEAITEDETCLWCVTIERITSLAGSPWWNTRAAQTSTVDPLNLLSSNYYSPEFWCLECDGPGARMRKTDTASIPTGFSSWTQVQTFSTEFDTASMVSGNALVLPEDGLWFLMGSGEWAAHATGTRGLQVVRGGYEVVGRNQRRANGAIQAMQVATLIEARAGDSLTLWAAQDSGGNLTLQGAADYACVFAAVKVSAGG